MPHRFDFDGTDIAHFQTKDGTTVSLARETWQCHILKGHEFEHLDFNRNGIIETLANYDASVKSTKNDNVTLYQKRFHKYYINETVRAPSIIVVVVDTHKRRICTIYTARNFKKG